jgi:hypothetical protein
MTSGSRAKQIVGASAALTVCGLLAACGASPASSTPPDPSAMLSTSTAASSTEVSTPAAASGGLVTAVHGQCDFGEKILHYLATGDNQGDPQLDTAFSEYVGVSLPRARSIADQQIQQCDARLSKQEAAQASAAAAASAADSAQAAAEQEEEAVQATQEKSCAAIGGTVDPKWGWCASTVQGNPSGEPGSDCEYASVAFNPDGTLATWSSSTTKDSYPGCFRL